MKKGDIVTKPSVLLTDSEPIIPLSCFDEQGKLKQPLLTIRITDKAENLDLQNLMSEIEHELFVKARQK